MFYLFRFGCYHERNPKACHLLGDYWEGIKKDFSKVPAENHCLLSLYEQNCIFLDLENLLHLGHNNRLLNAPRVVCRVGIEPGPASHHAGALRRNLAPSYAAPSLSYAVP